MLCDLVTSGLGNTSASPIGQMNSVLNPDLLAAAWHMACVRALPYVSSDLATPYRGPIKRYGSAQLRSIFVLI